MNPYFPRIRKSTLIEAVLGIVLLHTPMRAEELLSDDTVGLLSASARSGGKVIEELPDAGALHNTPSLKDLDKKKDTYTINFNNITIIEYLRFASKITNLNFIFNEDELQFSVSIVSEEPVTPRNILSILIQILRINGLVVLEQENNLLITKVRSVSQLATVVSSDLPEPKSRSPIVTRVFRIKNASLATVASVIKPMLSDSSLLEISTETKQLIVTDITTNVDKISSLLASIDAPHTSLEIESYVAQNINLNVLIKLATQIISPFAEGNALTFVPQAETSTIFIISTPYLIERALTVLEDLDTPKTENLQLATRSQTAFLYQPTQKEPQELLKSLDDVARQLQTLGASKQLIDCLNEAKPVQNSNAILFLADEETLSKVKDLLPKLDTSESSAEFPGKSNLYVYKIQTTSPQELQHNLTAMADDLQKAPQPNRALIHAITSMKYIPESNTLMFTGDATSLNKIKEILPTFDTATNETASFFLYKLQRAQGDVVIANLKNIAHNLSQSKYPNQSLISTLTDLKWVQDNNSLLLKGPQSSIEQARALIEQFDTPNNNPLSTLASKSSFFIYEPHHQEAKTIQNSLQKLEKDLTASGLSDADLLSTIQTMKYVEVTDSLLFTGTTDSLNKVKSLLEKVDVISSEEAHIEQLGPTTFMLYKVQYVPGPQLIASVKTFMADLEKRGAADPQMLETVSSLKWVQPTNSLMITGSPETLQKVEALIKKFDLESLAPRIDAPSTSSSFVVYTPKYQSGDELIKILDDFANNLMAAGVANKSLFEAISNLKWVPRTCSLIITGDEPSTTKIEELLRRFDIPTSDPSQNTTSIESIQNTSFLIYKLQYHQGSEILSALKQIGTDLGSGTSVGNQNLLSAINSLQWIRVTNSLLASGEADTLTKLRDLVQNLDVPLRQVFIEVLVIETSVNNTQNFGLQWGGKMQYLNKFALGTGNFPVPGANSISSGNPISTTLPSSIQNAITSTTASSFPQANGTNGIPFLSGFDLGVIGDIIMHKGRSFISLGSLVNALQTDTDSTIVMNPKIITQDNRTSTIFVGNNIPFIGSLVTTNANIVSSSSNIEYRDIGFNLTITPTIGNSDIVTLDINNDISEVTSTPAIGTSNATNQQSTITGIQTSHTSMTTRVHVPDQHFVVLSGMITDTKARFKSGIPCLGGLPVIGAIFSENDRVATKQNIIIFVRPHIVNTYEEYKAITDSQENVFKESAVMPVLKEELDAGIDLVKTPEND